MRRHSKRKEILKSIKRPLPKNKKVEARFASGLDETRACLWSLFHLVHYCNHASLLHLVQSVQVISWFTKKKKDENSIIEMNKDFRQHQQKQKAENEKRLWKELSGDLDYIKQEADRKKCGRPKTMGR